MFFTNFFMFLAGDDGEVTTLAHIVAPLARYHRADELVEFVGRRVRQYDALVDYHPCHVRPVSVFLLCGDSLVKLADDGY